MDTFKRVGNIISANFNSLLDSMESPEKQLALNILKMEDALVKNKSSYIEVAARIAELKKQVTYCRNKVELWQSRAELAVDKKNDELAKEALIEKKKYIEKEKEYSEQEKKLSVLNKEQMDEYDKLSAKLKEIKSRKSELLTRAKIAREKKNSEEVLHSANSVDFSQYFDEFESKIEKLEAQAGLVNIGSESKTTEQKFADMELNAEIDAELKNLKEKQNKNTK